MNRRVGVVLVLATAGLCGIALPARRPAAAADPAEAMIIHDVYFSLADAGPATRQRFVESCRKYLADHPGTVNFSVGVRAEEFAREVNDRDFDVALHIAFANKQAHDTYQASARHKQFIEENKPAMKKVRVFDSRSTGSRSS
jgi:hypothetical protein